MLDPDAQKSLLENAATVNQAILDATLGHLNELEEGRKKAVKADKDTGDNFHEKLFQKANESQLIQTVKLIDMYGQPGTGSTADAPKYVVKGEIQQSITGIQDLMQHRKIADEAVEEKLNIAKETSTVSSTSRTSQTLKDLIGGGYFKTGDPIIRINLVTNMITFSLKVKSNVDGESEMFICYTYRIGNKIMGQYIFSDNDEYTPVDDLDPPTTDQQKDKDYISTVEEMKKNIYFLAWDAAVEPTAPAPPSGIAAKTYVFPGETGSIYAPISTSMDDSAYFHEDKKKNQYTLYLPIQKDKTLAYLYVRNEETFTVEEIADDDLAKSDKQYISNDEDGIKLMKEKNPDFYKWWEEQDYTSFTIAEPPTSTFKRGSENIVTLWKQKTKQHADSAQPYADLEVGQAVHVSTFKGEKNSLNELRIITRSKTDLEGDGDGKQAMKTVIYVKEDKILSYKVESSKQPTKMFVNRDADILIKWLRDEKLREKFNNMLASVEYLGAIFQDITDNDVKETA